MIIKNKQKISISPYNINTLKRRQVVEIKLKYHILS